MVRGAVQPYEVLVVLVQILHFQGAQIEPGSPRVLRIYSSQVVAYLIRVRAANSSEGQLIRVRGS